MLLSVMNQHFPRSFPNAFPLSVTTVFRLLQIPFRLKQPFLSGFVNFLSHSHNSSQHDEKPHTQEQDRIRSYFSQKNTGLRVLGIDVDRMDIAMLHMFRQLFV